MQVSESQQWEHAMQEVMDSLLTNEICELAQLPAQKKALHNKRVYQVKQESDGIKRYKAKLVMKGFQQWEGVDYTEIFSQL